MRYINLRFTYTYRTCLLYLLKANIRTVGVNGLNIAFSQKIQTENCVHTPAL